MAIFFQRVANTRCALVVRPCPTAEKAVWFLCLPRIVIAYRCAYCYAQLVRAETLFT